jgi:1-deoxy-D-xylulose-5-phosphate reductoisomerase
MKKSIAIFGSTGSIGKNALQVVAQHLDLYQIEALVAGSDVKSLIEQARIFKPKYAAINQESHFSELKLGLKWLVALQLMIWLRLNLIFSFQQLLELPA